MRLDLSILSALLLALAGVIACAAPRAEVGMCWLDRSETEACCIVHVRNNSVQACGPAGHPEDFEIVAETHMAVEPGDSLGACDVEHGGGWWH